MYEIEVEELKDYRQRLDQLHACLNVEGIKRRIGEIEGRMAAHGFWDDPESAQKILQELKALRGIVAAPEELQRELEETASLIEMAAEENDATLGPDIAAMKEDVERKLRRLEITSLFNDPRDEKNAIVSIHPGAGGTESCDWADMLFRMFTRFCELHEFETEVMDFQPGEEAGLKSATVTVKGPYAYGTLKSEEGVHRLVRISPFDANKRRHTSFASVFVSPEIDDNVEIQINESDLKIDTLRSGGAGGQHVNKVESAVRVTHVPSGIVVLCQQERSQHKNRAMAMKILRSKLYELEMRQRAEKAMEEHKGKKDIAWRSQIRSYVLAPYQMVKDHRTGHDTGNVGAVLDGEIMDFIRAFLLGRKPEGETGGAE